jgi:formate hydrogenlyase transcriptional activator
VPLLVQFLISTFRARIGKPICGVTPDTMQRLVEYHWPGNVRELQNVLERAAILSVRPVIEIDPELLPARAKGASVHGDGLVSLSTAEREHILSALKQSNWIIDGPSGAARILEMHPNTLRSRMKKLGITRPTHEVS